MNNKSLGRGILYGMNAATALNGLLADWNRTHLYNPAWPPHAKYHDGMGISLGLLLGGLGIFALGRKRGNRSDNERLAALCPALFFGSMLTASAYPNSGSIETEFPDYWPKIGPFSFNELPFAATMLLVTAAGWTLAQSSTKGRAATGAPETTEHVSTHRTSGHHVVEQPSFSVID